MDNCRFNYSLKVYFLIFMMMMRIESDSFIMIFGHGHYVTTTAGFCDE